MTKTLYDCITDIDTLLKYAKTKALLAKISSFYHISPCKEDTALFISHSVIIFSMIIGRDHLSPFAADILGTGILPIAADAQARAGST